MIDNAIVLSAGATILVLAVLSYPVVCMRGFIPRLDAIHTKQDNWQLGGSCSVCAMHPGRGVTVFQPVVVSVAYTPHDLRINLASTPSAQDLLVAIRCASVDTIIVGPFMLGLTGRNGSSDGILWIGVCDGSVDTATPPYAVTAVATSALDYLSSLTSNKAVQTSPVMLAWRRNEW